LWPEVATGGGVTAGAVVEAVSVFLFAPVASPIAPITINAASTPPTQIRARFPHDRFGFVGGIGGWNGWIGGWATATPQVRNQSLGTLHSR
jgi:hypothetical protein